MTLEEQIQKLTAERDAARADLKAVGECVGGEPLAVRGLVESMDAVIKERDAALKAGAEMRDSPTWDWVMSFARLMEAKLAKNRHKGDRGGWIKEDLEWLLGRLKQELHELEIAIEQGHVRLNEPANAKSWAEKIAFEAADVANFAMMIADVSGALHPQSIDCGKGYHHDDEWRPVVEALEASKCNCDGLRIYGNPDFVCSRCKALAHAEKLTSQ